MPVSEEGELALQVNGELWDKRARSGLIKKRFQIHKQRVFTFLLNR
jgi:hypothetical protein